MAMLSKFTVSQTSGSFSSMRANSIFGLLACGSREYHESYEYSIYKRKGANLHKSTRRTMHTSALQSKRPEKNLHHCLLHLSGVDHELFCAFIP